jgi:hypothetical protein
MSTDNTETETVNAPTEALVEVAPQPAPTPLVALAPHPAAPLRLGDVDRLALELAKSRRETALAEAKTALANNEKSELSYRYVVLQLYMKYGLNETDAISENGEVVRGGALQPPKPQA